MAPAPLPHQLVILLRRLRHRGLAQILEQDAAELVVLPPHQVAPPLAGEEAHHLDVDALLEGVLDQIGAEGVHRLLVAAQGYVEIAEVAQELQVAPLVLLAAEGDPAFVIALEEGAAVELPGALPTLDRRRGFAPRGELLALVREAVELQDVDLPAHLRAQLVDAVAEEQRRRPVLPPAPPLQGAAEMAQRGVEVALDRALPLGGPDRLDHLLPPRLETGRGGQEGQHLEGGPEPPIEVPLPLLVPLPGDRAAQEPQDVAGRQGGGTPLGRDRRDMGVRLPPAPAALALQSGGEKTRQAVPLRPFDPQAALLQQLPGLLPGASGRGPGIRRVEQEVALVVGEGVQHLMAEERADGGG